MHGPGGKFVDAKFYADTARPRLRRCKRGDSTTDLDGPTTPSSLPKQARPIDAPYLLKFAGRTTLDFGERARSIAHSAFAMTSNSDTVTSKLTQTTLQLDLSNEIFDYGSDGLSFLQRGVPH